MTTPRDTFDEGELAAQIERNRQLELSRQRAQQAAEAAAKAAQEAQDETARKQAEEAARIAREQQIAAQNALEARKRLAAQQAARDQQQESPQVSTPTPQVETKTQVTQADVSKLQPKVEQPEVQTPTDTFQEGEIAAQEIKQAEISGNEPVSSTASKLETKVTNIQERSEEVQASIERLEAGVRDITGGLSQQELVQSIQTQLDQLEPERLTIEQKNQELLTFQETEIGRQQKGYDSLLRAIQDKIDRGVYKSQNELDAELELLGKSRNVLNEMVEKFNTDLEEVNALVEQYNAKYNTIVQGPDYQNLQEVNRYLQTTEAQSRIEEGEVVNEAIDSLTAEIDAFNKNLEVLSINAGQSPETITTGISAVQDAELKAAIEGRGQTDLHEIVYEGRPVLSVPTARKVEEEIALQAQVNAYREFRDLIEDYSRETGIKPAEDQVRKAFYEAYNLEAGNFNERAQELTGIIQSETVRNQPVAQPTSIQGDIGSPFNTDSEFETLADAAKEFGEGVFDQYQEVFVNKGLSSEEGVGPKVDLYGSSGFEFAYGKAQQGSIVAAEGLFQVELADNPEEFKRKMAFLTELAIQAGKEAVTDQEFSKAAQQAANELGIDLSDVDFTDLREKIATEAAAEFDNAQKKIEDLNRIIYDPSTTVSEKNKAIDEQNQIIESLAEFEQGIEAAQPGTRGQIIRLLAPASPLDIVLTGFLVKTAASTTTSAAKATVSGSRALGSRTSSAVSNIDLKLSPAAQERLVATFGRNVSQRGGVALEPAPRVARPNIYTTTPRPTTTESLARGNVDTYIRQVNNEFRGRLMQGVNRPNTVNTRPPTINQTPTQANPNQITVKPKITREQYSSRNRTEYLKNKIQEVQSMAKPDDPLYVKQYTESYLTSLKNELAAYQNKRFLSQAEQTIKAALQDEVRAFTALTKISNIFSSPNVEANATTKTAITEAINLGIDPELINNAVLIGQQQALEKAEKVVTPTASESFGITSPELESITAPAKLSSLVEEDLLQASKTLSTEKASQLKTVQQPSQELQLQTVTSPSVSPQSSSIISTEPASLDALKTVEQPATQPITQPTTEPISQTTVEPISEPLFEPLQQPKISSSSGIASAATVANSVNIGQAGPLRFSMRFPNSLANVKSIPQSKINIVKPPDLDDEEEEESPSQKELQGPSISATRLFRLIPYNQNSVEWQLRKVSEAGGPIMDKWGPFAIPDILSSAILSDKGRKKLKIIFNTQGTRVTQGEDLILTLLALGRIGRNEASMILPFDVKINSGDLSDA